MDINSQKYQILTSFPNSNDKHTDYVLVYKELTESDDIDFKLKCSANREIFFERLAKESIEVYKIERQTLDLNSHTKIGFGMAIQAIWQTNEFKVTFALLHCKTERLLREAELINLEMKLKMPDNLKTSVDAENQGISSLIKNFNRPLKNDGTGSIASYRFDSSIRFIFDGVDDPDNPQGPFNNTTRILLVDHIINNFFVDNLNQGIAFMLDNNYIDDAFVLHDQTADLRHLNSFFHFINQTFKDDEELSKDFIQNYIRTIKNFKQNDARKHLNDRWAKFSNIFHLQPMWSIRNYFGEYYSLYLAWLGSFVSTLWFITIIGILLYVIGICVETVIAKNANSTTSSNSTKSFDRIFAGTFDNYVTPFFAFCLCIWGVIFIEFWKRENTRLAYEWDVENFERYEPELPEYKRRQNQIEERLKKNGFLGVFIFRHVDFLRKSVSFLVILFMIGIVCMDIAAVIVYRIYFEQKVFPTDKTLKFIFGDLGSVFLNAIFTIILQYVYNRIAKYLTKWENHKTLTSYQDSLVVKLFAFEFVNNFGYLFYLAYIRGIHLKNGLFNMGENFQDSCDVDCMSLLSTQVLVLLLIQPMPRFCYTVIYPYLVETYKKTKIDDYFTSYENNMVAQQSDVSEMSNEKAVFLYLSIEKTKADACDTIVDEYTEKVLLFGYLIVTTFFHIRILELFSSCLSLGPLIVLIINLLDVRIDGQRLLWLYRRPVGYKAQDIGSWFHILRALNIIGIINNSFMMAFTSNWSKKFFVSTENSFYFAVAFEHFVFLIWFLIILFTPEISDTIKQKMRDETENVQKIVKGAKILGAEHRLNSLQTVSTLETVANSDSIEKTFNKVKIKSKSNSNSSLSKVN